MFPVPCPKYGSVDSEFFVIIIFIWMWYECTHTLCSCIWKYMYMYSACLCLPAWNCLKVHNVLKSLKIVCLEHVPCSLSFPSAMGQTKPVWCATITAGSVGKMPEGTCTSTFCFISIIKNGHILIASEASRSMQGQGWPGLHTRLEVATSPRISDSTHLDNFEKTGRFEGMVV